MNEMMETDRLYPRRKPPGMNTNRDEIIDKFTDFICNRESDLKNVPASTLPEIEVRIGRQKPTSFESSIYEKDFQIMINLAQNACKMVEDKVETDYMYDVGNAQVCRLSYDENDVCIKAISKQKGPNSNLPTARMGWSYDFRIAYALETSFELPPSRPSQPPLLKRVKKRKTFSLSGNSWKIEFTDAHSIRSNESESRTLEVEFELEESAVELLKKNEITPKELASQLWACLEIFTPVLCSNVLYSSDTVHLPGEFSMVKAQRVSDAVKNPLKQMIYEHVPNLEEQVVTRDSSFPGSLPITFSRRHFEDIISKDYYVSEKTDGTRFMMLIVPGGVYLVDRSFIFYSISGFEQLIPEFTNGGPTILDGELVINQKTIEPWFMIFDVLAIKGTRFGYESLTKRLEGIRDFIIDYRKLKDGPCRHTIFPFNLIGKAFYRKQDLIKLLQNIHYDKGLHLYDDGKQRCHKTDGIIFTPNTPYSARGVQNLYKWKFMEHITIDFQVVTVNGQYSFYCNNGSNKPLVEFDIQFIEKDRIRFEEDRRKYGLEGGAVIVECSYDSWSACWRYHQIRKDKTIPNHIRIAIESLLAIAQNITLEELQFRLTRRDGYRWQSLVTQHLRELVAEQHHHHGNNPIGK
jgi:mRNA guanylyltransferase